MGGDRRSQSSQLIPRSVNERCPASARYLPRSLPGFVVRTRLKRAERTSLDFSPFGQVVAEAVLWAFVSHVAWLAISDAGFDRTLDPAVLLKLPSSEPNGQAVAA